MQHIGKLKRNRPAPFDAALSGCYNKPVQYHGRRAVHSVLFAKCQGACALWHFFCFRFLSRKGGNKHLMYVAEFKHNGVDYQIVAEQMGIEEVVKVVASIITGEKDIAVDEGAYTKNYKDVSELPNTEPNWTDTPDTTSENTANKLETENWEVTIDEGPYMENYEDIPELPNAEPNWIDTPDATLENTNDNLDTENWEVIIDEGPYMENYKDIPELPNAEPNWID